MGLFVRLILAEMVKLKRSPASRLIWLLPLLFLTVFLVIFEFRVLNIKVMSESFQGIYETMPLKMAVGLWGGFFHPLALALLAAMLFRSEHRFRMWPHLHSQATSPGLIFSAKYVVALGAVVGMLGMVWVGMVFIRSLIGWYNPVLEVPLHAWDLYRVLWWMGLASLPALGFYLWISDRINNVAVPVVFGLVSLLLTIALGVQENPKPWRRDVIPLVTPYFSAQWVMLEVTGKQEAHLGAKIFQDEPDRLRLPSGKIIRTWQNIPDEVLFPPPLPTPRWILVCFSLIGGLLFFGLGWWDSGRNRT